MTLAWLHPRPTDPPDVETCFDALRAAVSACAGPSHVCSQCYGDDMAARLVTAARVAESGEEPAPRDYAQICFEHPECSGGIETIQLFTPHALRRFFYGVPFEGFPHFPDIHETMTLSGRWFWPAPMQDALRQLAGRLLIDRFRHDLQPVPLSGTGALDADAIDDDILQFAHSALIDPRATLHWLATLGTAAADRALELGIDNAGPGAPSYCALDRGGLDAPRPYLEATEAITATLSARAARATLEIVTEDWLEAAFFRNETRDPALAQSLSDTQRYFGVRTIRTREYAALPQRTEWPAPGGSGDETR
ncbi:hypothetical protein [Jannaschia marina]|uniref:hypothetical protein n=1 Tax=Jannaschia marina TaxID=2741674 RepID=UPI0015CE8C4B|nr:hypothetical protein [Jannaschia marina]